MSLFSFFFLVLDSYYAVVVTFLLLFYSVFSLAFYLSDISHARICAGLVGSGGICWVGFGWVGLGWAVY